MLILRSFVPQKTVQWKWKGNWEKLFEMHVFHKYLLCRIYGELLLIKKTYTDTNQRENGQRAWKGNS